MNCNCNFKKVGCISFMKSQKCCFCLMKTQCSISVCIKIGLDFFIFLMSGKWHIFLSGNFFTKGSLSHPLLSKDLPYFKRNRQKGPILQHHRVSPSYPLPIVEKVWKGSHFLAVVLFVCFLSNVVTASKISPSRHLSSELPTCSTNHVAEETEPT